MRTNAMVWAVVAAAGLACGAHAQVLELQPAGMQRVCYFGEDARGVRGNGHVWMPVVPKPIWPGDVLPAQGVARILPDGSVVPAEADGMSTNRYVIVVVGDGYQAAQQTTFNTHASSTTNYLLTQEPFATYLKYFNIFRVNVTSIDSGVDNDPTQGILRNTAMDMAFWCGGTERLLCVNVTKAYQFANNAPQAPDQVLALANSTKYGGAGYSSNNLGTSSGGNASAPEIVVHELGHSMGDLADEYDYGGPSAWPGGEPTAANVSIFTAGQQQVQQRKWWRWVGVNNASFDGLHSTFEGANYSVTGIYRPTNNSKMRALGRPFNFPSAEALIIEIYRQVRPIDEFSPPNGPVVQGAPTLWVTPMEPIGAGQQLAIQWYVDNVAIPGATGRQLNLANVNAPNGLRTVRVTVVDNTFMVRDPVARANLLTQNLTWQWNNQGQCYANCDGSTAVPLLTPADFVCFLNRFRNGESYANCDGSTNVPTLTPADFVCFLNRFRAGC